MASQFAIVDRHALSRLALLVDDFESATDPKLRAALAAEIRAEGKAFGLTPLDRRRGGLPTEIADAVYCEDCGESFVPSRVDSRLCSGCRRA